MCKSQDCTAQAVGRGDRKPAEWCVNHGGGKRCNSTGCNNLVYRNAEMCTYHGGGRSCSVRGCNKLSIINGMRCSVHTLISDGMLNPPPSVVPVATVVPVVPVALPIPQAPVMDPVAPRPRNVRTVKRKASAPISLPEKRSRKPSLKSLDVLASIEPASGPVMIYREPIENIFVYKFVDDLSTEPGVEGLDYFRL